MNESKVIDLFKNKSEKAGKPVNKASSCSFHTNPIVKDLLYNSDNKKNKFKIEDLLR